MKHNITIALATVAALLVGTLAGNMTLALGMLVHEGSVLIVILNAMRLLGPGHKNYIGRYRCNGDDELIYKMTSDAATGTSSTTADLCSAVAFMLCDLRRIVLGIVSC